MSDSKLFQIHEDDLAALERAIPRLGDALFTVMGNRERVLLRQCQMILSKVRWGYGPPGNIKRIGVDPDAPPPFPTGDEG